MGGGLCGETGVGVIGSQAGNYAKKCHKPHGTERGEGKISIENRKQNWHAEKKKEEIFKLLVKRKLGKSRGKRNKRKGKEQTGSVLVKRGEGRTVFHGSSPTKKNILQRKTESTSA